MNLLRYFTGFGMGALTVGACVYIWLHHGADAAALIVCDCLLLWVAGMVEST